MVTCAQQLHTDNFSSVNPMVSRYLSKVPFAIMIIYGANPTTLLATNLLDTNALNFYPTKSKFRIPNPDFVYQIQISYTKFRFGI